MTTAYVVKKNGTLRAFPKWVIAESYIDNDQTTMVKKFDNMRDAVIFTLRTDPATVTDCPPVELVCNFPDVLAVYVSGIKQAIGVYFNSESSSNIGRAYSLLDDSHETQLNSVICALQIILENVLDFKEKYKIVYLYTESRYLIAIAYDYRMLYTANNFRKNNVKFRTLIEQIWALDKQLYDAELPVRYEWIRFKDSDYGCEQAKYLAAAAAASQPPV
jgi:ribonuclease HI